MMNVRSSGILCHISSLPSPYGIGDLGGEAFRFVDLLSRAGQRWWQVLPLSPTENGLGNSPYSSCSAFAFNPLFISPQALVQEGFLALEDIKLFEVYPSGRVDYDQVYLKKGQLLALVFDRYQQREAPLKAFEDFCRQQAYWLDDFSLFVVLKRMFANACWAEWPTDFRDRAPGALDGARRDKAAEIQQEKFTQFLFYRQWRALQEHCSAKGVGVIGDIPIYVNYDSADVWTRPELFKLDPEKKPVFVAGVPPDYFSEEGQYWGNPVYDWNALRATGFSWWIDRIRHNLALFDVVRIDHFRAFAQCWEIPAGEKNAIRGAWCDVPGMEFFSALQKTFPLLPIIAEDLGIITPDVDALKEYFRFFGMRVVMFAFHNEYKKSRDLPENHTLRSVVYTGTHDNNTARGWRENDMTEIEKKNFLEYFGSVPAADKIHWTMIRLAMGSVANICIIPLQDLLGCGESARMNCPSTTKGNWRWRFEPDAAPRGAWPRLRRLTIQRQRART